MIELKNKSGIEKENYNAKKPQYNIGWQGICK
jgi:hypothetical protein